MDNSYKQKKLEEFDEKFLPKTKRIECEGVGDNNGFYEMEMKTVSLEDIKSFISSLIDETEKKVYERGLLDRKPEIHLKKLTISQDVDMPDDVREYIRQQAKSEMKEDLIKWARETPWAKTDLKNMQSEGVILLSDLINYLNKQNK